MRKRVNEYHFHLVPMVSARQIVKFSYCILELIASVRDWMWNVNARTLIFINVCFQEHVHLTAFSFMNLLCKKKRRYDISLERNVFFFFSKENSIFDWKAVFLFPCHLSFTNEKSNENIMKQTIIQVANNLN